MKISRIKHCDKLQLYRPSHLCQGERRKICHGHWSTAHFHDDRHHRHCDDWNNHKLCYSLSWHPPQAVDFIMIIFIITMVIRRGLTTTCRCSSFRFALFTVMTPATTFFSITIVKINMIYGEHNHKDDADWQLAGAAAAATEMGVGRETFVPAIKLLTWTWCPRHLWSVAWLGLENVGNIQAQILKSN